MFFCIGKYKWVYVCVDPRKEIRINNSSRPNTLNHDYICYSDIQISYRLNCRADLFCLMFVWTPQESVDIADFTFLFLGYCRGISQYAVPAQRKWIHGY